MKWPTKGGTVRPTYSPVVHYRLHAGFVQPASPRFAGLNLFPGNVIVQERVAGCLWLQATGTHLAQQLDLLYMVKCSFIFWNLPGTVPGRGKASEKPDFLSKFTSSSVLRSCCRCRLQSSVVLAKLESCHKSACLVLSFGNLSSRVWNIRLVIFTFSWLSWLFIWFSSFTFSSQTASTKQKLTVWILTF